MNSRMRRVYAGLKKENLDGVLVSSPSNITYLTKYQSRDSYLLVSAKKNIYFTDSRYTQEAKKHLKENAQIVQTNGALLNAISAACSRLGLKRIAFEEKDLSYAQYYKISEKLKPFAAFIPFYGIIEKLRQLKDKEELDKITKAAQITALAIKFIQDIIRPGKKEIEIAGELEHFIRYNGAQYSSFNIIVASGPNSSYPHHITSERRLRNNELVLIDLGVDFQGYKSDLTRVFFLGKIHPLVKKIYNIVEEAQKKAIKKIRESIEISNIDLAARQYITQKGYGAFFSHSLGHGIGLEIHENPTISPRQTAKLKQGMVFTIEPGIYLPGKFGIRIEDMVVVTKKGSEVLSGPINK